MARYDYKCPNCLHVCEISHGMTETPVVTCECGEKMKKKISSCNVIVRNTLSTSSKQDSRRREVDMKMELKEEHGIHNFTPFGGATTADVLRDVKGSGTYVKDQMDFEHHRNEERRKAKLKEWTPKAQKRASKRRAEMKERKAAEAAKKRKIKTA